MKNSATIITIVVLAALGIGAFIFLQKPKQTDTTMVTSPVTPTGTLTAEQEAMIEDQGRYIEYSRESLDSAASGRRVLFFYASWCPICRPADANFKANPDQIPDDVTLIRVNYNDPDTDQEEKALAAKYGVVYQHTFVQIDAQGNEVAKWNGGEIEELLARIK